MAENLQSNPFAGLFSSITAAELFIKSQHQDSIQYNTNEPNLSEDTLCLPDKQNETSTAVPFISSGKLEDTSYEEAILLEYLFLVSATNPPLNSWHPCVWLPDSSITAEAANITLFERLLLEKPFSVAAQGSRQEGASVQHTERWTYSSAGLGAQSVEGRVLYYLLGIYERCAVACKKLKTSSRKDKSSCLLLIEAVEREVLINFHTAIHQPDLYESQDVLGQFKELLHDKLAESDRFNQLLMGYLNRAEEENTELPSVFHELLHYIEQELRDCELLTINWQLVNRLEFFTQTPELVAILLSDPSSSSLGVAYQRTALGRLLAISCLPQLPLDPSTFFQNSSRLTKEEVMAINASIESTQKMINERLYHMFHVMLSHRDSKHRLLLWLEGCIASNLGRAGLWHVAGGGAMAQSAQYVSDGFMLNLADVLAQLAHKFTQETADKDQLHPIMNVDPSFCFTPSNDDPDKTIPGSYPANLSSLTTLIPQCTPDDAGAPTTVTTGAPLGAAGAATNAVPPTPQKYTFVTSCFFFTNAALHLGLGVVKQRLDRVQQDLSRMHREHAGLSDAADPALRRIVRDRVASLTSTYLTLRAAVLPMACKSLPIRHLLGATAHWLTQVAQTPANSPWDPHRIPAPLSTTSIPETGEQDSVPPPQRWLQWVPELLVENIAQLSMLARLLDSNDTAPLFDLPVNSGLLTFLITFIGANGRIKNPHLRGELAQTLELLLLGEPLSSATDVNKTSSFAALLPGVWEELVVRHPLATHLPTALLRVFVSIEMTGQSVAFEEKFKYRGPMYEVLKHLWQVPSQRALMVGLATDSLNNMESTKPPLFLRFVNLLINDNIFLLDEGLSYMTQLREMQQQKDRGEWDALDDHGQQEKERMLAHTAMLARFHNVFARRTTATLLMLTEEHELASLLCHKTLVERVAAMLNFYLDHLVGPKQRTLKVRDTEQYEFRPAELVALICRLYSNLSVRPQFGAAVIADGRSYSPYLLDRARDVLVRVGEGILAGAMAGVQRCVAGAARAQQEEEDLTAAAPDHFLDPIMSILMRDPVVLPSSKMVVERATIARHLLSDQTDPFNRQPLTMDQVTPDVALAKEIHEWIQAQTEEARRKQEEEERVAEEAREAREKEEMINVEETESSVKVLSVNGGSDDVEIKCNENADCKVENEGLEIPARVDVQEASVDVEHLAGGDTSDGSNADTADGEEHFNEGQR